VPYCFPHFSFRLRIRFSGQTAAWVAQHRLRARLSLSHEGGMALAFCTLEEES